MSLSRVRAHPVFFSVMAVLGLLGFGEAWCLRERIDAARRERVQLERLAQEARTLASAKQRDSAVTAELAAARAERAALQVAFANGVNTGELPQQRAEAYFDLAAFLERMRAGARRHGVEIAADEAFGFAEYTSTGPEATAIEAVFRDRVVVESLLNTLFASRPSRLLSVQRARRETSTVERVHGTVNEFDFDSQRSAAVAGLVEGRAFRLTFVARTESVRALLNRLAETRSAFAVRSVEVSAFGRAGFRVPASSNDKEPVLLIAGGESRVVMVVEWLESKMPIHAAAGTVDVLREENTRLRWSPPLSQQRGAGWIYELFSPPDIYRDSRTLQLSVAKPAESDRIGVPEMGGTMEPEAFALELLEVKRALFPLQLIGFVGGETEYCGLFEDTTTKETFLARGACRRPGVGLRIEDFAVSRMTVPLAESMTTQRLVALARVRDERTGTVVPLNSLERRHTDEAIAVVTWGDATQKREVREGDAIEAEGAMYRIGKIQLQPPALEVSRESPAGRDAEPRTLTAREVETAAPPPAS